ncbi:MAG: hypothetical protein R3176_02750 [Woeseiaceae bacterium]|nr:hypothetical protein [Woeseiaceae bacterium]
MKLLFRGHGALAVVVAVAAVAGARADEDIYEGCRNTLSDPSYGSAQFRASCQEQLGLRQAELAAWGVDTSGMSKVETWDRHIAESRVRDEARREQERLEYLERERLATERARAEAEQAKVAAASNREAERHAAEQMKAGQQMLEEQDAMLKGLGVNLGSTSRKHQDCPDDDYEAAELNMYQAMVDQGVAPQCDGLTCAEFVDCVDEVVDAEED